MGGDKGRATAVLDCHFVQAVCVENEHIRVAGNRVRADHARMIKLYL